MPEITRTSFVDFVLANGTSRLTELRRIKKRFDDGYAPAMDFYKDLRESFQHYHGGDLEAPGRVVAAAGPRKFENYEDVAKNHANFARITPILSSFEPPRTTWHAGDLSVVVNPELGLRFPDGPTAVKLYFKAPMISRRRADIVLHLMKRSLEAEQRPPAVGLLDLRRAKLFFYRPTPQNLDILLLGEAAAFCAMWSLLNEAA